MTFGDWLTTTLFPFLLAILPGGLWMAFWLWAVNWKKVWPVLADGAWAPCVLLGLVIALAWSRVVPVSHDFLGFTLPNFWWQLGCVIALAACALFSGWLQAQLGFTPMEVAVEPAAGHDHGHDDGHNHEEAPAANHGHAHHHYGHH